MELTTEVVSKYVGGQLEIQNSSEHYLYRGEVERALVEGTTLHVKFKWQAQMGDDFEWHAENDLDYSVSLEIYGVSEIGDGRIALNSPYTHELAVFFPPDGSKLDPSKVIGLQLAS